jgi:hypothetical protein
MDCLSCSILFVVLSSLLVLSRRIEGNGATISKVMEFNFNAIANGHFFAQDIISYFPQNNLSGFPQ